MSSTGKPASAGKTVVKGTLLLDYVKLIRTNPDRPWAKWLTPEDLAIVHGQVLASGKYPFVSFSRIGYSVFKEIASSNLEIVRGFGHFFIKGMMEVYGKSVLVPGDAVETISKFTQLYKVWMIGGVETSMEKLGDKKLVFRITPPEEGQLEEGTKAYMHQVAGQIEELVRLACGATCRVEVHKTATGYDFIAEWE
jgi:hypothetical protein